MWGIDTTREFQELRHILDTDYNPVFEGDGYLILEHRKYTEGRQAHSSRPHRTLRQTFCPSEHLGDCPDRFGATVTNWK